MVGCDESSKLSRTTAPNADGGWSATGREAMESGAVADGRFAMAGGFISNDASGARAMTLELAPLPVQPPADRKLIRTAYLNFTAKDTEAAAQQIEALAEQWGGFIARVDGRGDPGFKHYTLVVRLPGRQLDAARAAVKALAARVVGESVETQDVTDAFADLEARRIALETTEGELLELLGESRESGRKLDDIMALYDKLTDVRAKIEQIQGRLNVMADQAAYSTLQIQISPDALAVPVIDEKWSATATTRESARRLVTALQGMADIGIRFVVLILPIALIVAIVIGLPGYLILRLSQRFARKSEKRAAA
jgi:hypothetical protein